MKKRIPRKVNSITDLGRCWIAKGDQYRLHEDGSKKNLPVVDKKYEDILKQLQIQYKVVVLANEIEGCEYWDKNKYQTRKETLPVYTFLLQQYHYIGDHTDDIPTDETIQAANELTELINEKLEEVKKKERIELIKFLLDGKNCVYVDKNDIKGKLREEELQLGNDHFYIFIVRKSSGSMTRHILIFDANRIRSEEVKIKLPADSISYIIGKGGCNFKRWKRIMRIEEIDAYV